MIINESRSEEFTLSNANKFLDWISNSDKMVATLKNNDKKVTELIDPASAELYWKAEQAQKKVQQANPNLSQKVNGDKIKIPSAIVQLFGIDVLRKLGLWR